MPSHEPSKVETTLETVGSEYAIKGGEWEEVQKGDERRPKRENIVG